MQTEHVYNLHGDAKIKREELLIRTGLEPDETVDFTLLLWDGDILAAAGSRKGYILKCIAIDERYRGQDLTAVLLTELRREAFSQDIRHLFLYTKPGKQVDVRIAVFLYGCANRGRFADGERERRDKELHIRT
ncbi:MAG: GNAT family N-acetyltransferase [Acetivibrionales bacterium]